MGCGRRGRIHGIDDDPSFLELTRRRLEANDWLTVESESDPEAGLEAVGDVDCVVLDYRMEGIDGLTFLQRLREDHSLPVILFTGAGSEEIASEAIGLGVTDYLLKSSDAERFQLLANRIRYLVERERSQAAAAAAERRVREVYERISVPFFAVDDEWRFSYLNDNAEALFEIDEADVLEESLWETFPDLEGTEAEPALRSSCADQETVTCEASLPALGRTVVFQTYPDSSGLSVFVDDVTDDRRREAELEELRRELELGEEQFCTLKQKYARPPSPFR